MSGEPDECSEDFDEDLFTSDPTGLPGAAASGTTREGVKLPSLPTTSYSYDLIGHTWEVEHKSNGSFREHFVRGDRDLNSVLVGGYIKCVAAGNEEITGKLGGGKHSDSDNGKAGRCYNIDLRIDGSSVRIRKENPHSNYYETGISRILSLGTRSGHYTGVMFMKVNQTISGQDCVRLIGYVDTAGMNDAGVFTASAQNWVKIIDVTDTGQLGEGPAQAIWLTTATPGNSQATIRTDEQDASSYDFKLGFAARIKGGPAY